MTERSETPTDVASALPGVARLVSADARQALEQIRSSPMLADGKVCLLGLDAIRERMGPRWAVRRDMVFEHVNSTLRKQLGPHGFYLRISETDFLVAQPGVGKLAGQAYCLNCLREVLTYFLGEALVSDIVVHEVTEIGDGHIGARRLDALALEAEAARVAPPPPAEPKPVAPPPKIGGEVASPDRWSPFTAHDGRRLRASSNLDPVFQLKTYGRIGYRMTRRVLAMPGETELSPAEMRQLTRSDIERIDFATLARGLNRLAQEADGERQPSLILPVSFVTLSNHRGRATVSEFFRAAQASVQRGLICEVCDIEGVPAGAMLTAVSLIRPFCLFAIGRLSAPPPSPLAGWQDVGLQGFSIECPPTPMSDDAFGGFCRTLVAATRPAARSLLLYGVDGPRHAALASLHGATHASFVPERAAPPRAAESALETA